MRIKNPKQIDLQQSIGLCCAHGKQLESQNIVNGIALCL